LGEVARYTRAADQKRLAEAARVKLGTSVVKRATRKVSNTSQAVEIKGK
jgi:hypothetical protein